MKRVLNQGVVAAMIATSVGCSRTPEADMKAAMQEAAAACSEKPKPSDNRGRKRLHKFDTAFLASVPCETVQDNKDALALAAAEAGARCEGLMPGETRLYQNRGVIASCTRAKAPENPFATTLAPDASASSPAKSSPSARQRLKAERESADAASSPTR